MPLSDCHTHLDRYPPVERERLIRRAQAAGVGLLLVAGTDAESSEVALKLAQQHAIIRACVGLHPLQANRTEEWPRIAEMAPKAAAISETGLDFSPGAPDHDLQREMLRRHLALNRPVIAHLVATDELPEARAPLAVHYFQGGKELAARYLEAGFLISVGKPVLRNAELREAMAGVPLDRLLLETDSYPWPGRSTEPADVRQVAEALAGSRGASVEAVLEATWWNLKRLLDGGSGPAAG